MSPQDILLAILNEHFEPCCSTANSFPGWVLVENGQGISISPVMAKLIRQLSDNIYPKRRFRTTSRNDWQKQIEQILAPKLFYTSSTSFREHIANQMWIDILSEIKDDISNFSIDQIFGCSLFYENSIESINIGPVIFYSKIFWLNQIFIEGKISKTTHRRLLAKWQGEHIRPRKRGSDAASESAISHAVGDADFVCVVRTEGLIGETARTKAALAARLGLAVVSLAWQKPSNALRNMNLNFDGAEYLRKTAFTQASCSDFFQNLSRSGIPGQPLLSQSWAEIENQHQPILQITGEILQYLLSPDGMVERPNLMDALGHALIWFNGACREENSMIAVTKFMACIDSLSHGTSGANGLISVVTTRLGVQPDLSIHQGGPSFRDALTKLYGEGRSRLLHGNSTRLTHDWSNERELSESFARIALVLCLHWASRNPTSDDPKAMAESAA